MLFKNFSLHSEHIAGAVSIARRCIALQCVENSPRQPYSQPQLVSASDTVGCLFRYYSSTSSASLSAGGSDARAFCSGNVVKPHRR